MVNRWNRKDAEAFCKVYGQFEKGIALQAYATRLLGEDPSLALHGGGNTSVKTRIKDITGREVDALYVKSSGKPMNLFTPGDFVVMDLDFLRNLRNLDSLDDKTMADMFSIHMLFPHPSRPSIETLMHAFIPEQFISHSHPDAILALTNRENGETFTSKAFGEEMCVIPYVRTGYDLAKTISKAILQAPGCSGLVIACHGLVTWGESAEEAYSRHIHIVDRAEKCLDKKRSRIISTASARPVDESNRLYRELAPVIRSALSPKTGDGDNPVKRMILSLLNEDPILKILDWSEAKDLAITPPLTPDYLIRTRTLPMWIDNPDFDDTVHFRRQLDESVVAYCKDYEAYITRNRGDAAGLKPEDLYPRVVFIPGLGAICAGIDAAQSLMIRDITLHAITVKKDIYETGGTYRSIDEEHLYDMEFRSFQRAKLGNLTGAPLTGAVALVTGSAGAIGIGIVEALLNSGCNVAVTDLAGPALEEAGKRFKDQFGPRAESIAMDVTNEESVAEAYRRVIEIWGGCDIVVVNAGIAHVSALADMELERFRKLEAVNVDGTLLTIREAARLFKKQKMGGDIVVVSTKNVFAPGAKFGAYSATKAASHQLARIAVLELAELGVRVNMVAPDAIFSHGDKKSGLWAEVGPDRMKARGLDEKGLEEYYRSRNLLKAKITAEHVAKAVLFFVTHQTPTTGATIPVDGGLPDATPR